jgi:hypothetical protein
MSFAADHVEGFEELLAAAGSEFDSDFGSFRGLVRKVEPESTDYDLSPSDDDAIRISAHRTEVPPELISLGASFRDEAGFHYRVNRLQRPPKYNIVHLECTVLNP